MKVLLEIMKLILAYKNSVDQTKKVVTLILGLVEACDPLEVAGLEELEIIFLD